MLLVGQINYVLARVLHVFQSVAGSGWAAVVCRVAGSSSSSDYLVVIYLLAKLCWYILLAFAFECDPMRYRRHRRRYDDVGDSCSSSP